MKKTRLLMVAIAVTVMAVTQAPAQTLSQYAGDPLVPNNPGGNISAPEVDVVLTQNLNKMVEAGSIACASGMGADTTDNSYFRTFDLSTLPFGTSQDFQINSVDMGVELAEGPTADPTADVLGTFFFYANPDSTPDNTVGLLGSVDVTIAGGTALTVLNFPGGPLVPSGTDWLLVEFFQDNDESLDDPDLNGDRFFIGSNAAGQLNPSYIQALPCGLNDPTNIADIGFPDMHIILNVNGSQVPEPSAALMGLLGLAGILGLRRRR